MFQSCNGRQLKVPATLSVKIGPGYGQVELKKPSRDEIDDFLGGNYRAITLRAEGL